MLSNVCDNKPRPLRPTGLRIKRSKVPVSLAVEIYIFFQVHSALPYKLSSSFSFGGDIEPLVRGTPESKQNTTLTSADKLGLLDVFMLQ